MFIGSKAQFIPVLDKKEEMVGIITSQAIFKEYQKVFGTSVHHTIVLSMHDVKGGLAELAENLAKSGANINNVRQRDTEILGVQEVTVKVECSDLEKVVSNLKKKDFNVRQVIPATK